MVTVSSMGTIVSFKGKVLPYLRDYLTLCTVHVACTEEKEHWKLWPEPDGYLHVP